MPLRLAVIGVGHLGRIHARLARSCDFAELVGVADVSEATRMEVASELGVPAVADYRQLLGRMDAAVLATPTSSHFEIGCALLREGVPLLVEKPLARCLEEAEQLVQLAESRNLVLQVGHVERFNPALEVARPLLTDAKFISAERLSGYPDRSTDVGVVLDLMIHDLDIVESVVAAPVRRVEALGVAVIGPHEDIATTRLEFENGCVANLTASRVSYASARRMQFFTPSGHVAVDLAARHAAVVDFRGPGHRSDRSRTSTPADVLERRDLTIPDANPIADEQRDFVASIRERLQPRVPGAAGRDAIALAERVLESIARHQWDGHELGRVGPDIAVPGGARRYAA